MCSDGDFRQVLPQNRRHGLRPGIAMKCTVAAKYFVQHRSECKYVTARVGGLAAHLLRRHVTRGSEHQSGRRSDFVGGLRDTGDVGHDALCPLRGLLNAAGDLPGAARRHPPRGIRRIRIGTDRTLQNK